jgi:hypothetical protein
VVGGFYCFTASTCTTTHVFGETPVHAVVHAKHRAVHGGFKVTPTHFALEHGVLVASKLAGLEGDGGCFTQQRQRARHGRDLVAIKRELVAHKRQGGVFGRIEQVGALQVLVKRRRAAVDGSGVDGDFNLAGFGGFVQRDAAGFLVKAATVGGRAKVANFKRGKRVGGVNGVSGWLGVGQAGRQQSRSGQGNDGRTHGKTPVG